MMYRAKGSALGFGWCECLGLERKLIRLHLHDQQSYIHPKTLTQHRDLGACLPIELEQGRSNSTQLL